MFTFKKVLGALALLLCSLGAWSQTKIEFGSPTPSKGPEGRAQIAFFQRIEQQTKGQLKFSPSFEGQVVNFRTALGGVKDGLVDSIFLVPAFYLSELKGVNTFVDMAVFAGDPWAHTAAVAETMLLNCPQCDAELARYKTKALAVSGSGPFMLMCRNPIGSLADIKGKSIRAASAFQGMAKAIGANPVATVPSEVFEAMQRGQVECVTGGLDWMQQFGLADVAKFVLDTPVGHDHARVPLAINADVWKRLSADQKQAITRNLAFLTAEGISNNLSDTKASREFAEKKGIKFASAGPELAAVITSYRKGDIDRVTKDATSRGVERADVLMATFRDKLNKWEKIVAGLGGDRAKYEEALWGEIYSKLR